MNQSSRLVLPVDAIVFDCDGVLVDSLVGVDRSWRRWALDFDLDPDVVLAHVHGRPTRESVERFVAEPHRAVALERIDRYEIEDAAEVTALPGAAALLASLPSGRWGIVTSAGRTLFEARIASAGLPAPEVVVTAADVARGKPHPEGYLAAMARLGADPARAAIFEDSEGGLAAAIASGAGSVIRVGSSEAAPGLAAAIADLRDASWDGRLLVGRTGETIG
jgi:sugar-phosphatase